MKNYRFSSVSLMIYMDKILGNFIHNIDIRSLSNVELLQYRLKDYDTPENICYRLYGDSSISWVLLWLNGIIDPFYEWPLNTNELYKYINNKYGSQHINDIHHWEINSRIVNKSKDAIPITNEIYEIRLNDKKRNILIPSAELISSFLSNLNDLNNLND